MCSRAKSIALASAVMWMLGGVDRVTKKVFVRIVDDRTRDTLLLIIQDNIEIGSTNYSDTFRVYFTLSQLGYQHQIVNHSREFVSEDGVCTNTIESLWGKINAVLKIRSEEEVCERTICPGIIFSCSRFQWCK